jgi:quinol monooxygenase YgiN
MKSIQGESTISHHSVVAKIRARPDMGRRVQQEMENLVGLTRRLDKGCISYELFQDSEDNDLFWFVETWEDEEHLKRHLESDHMKAYFLATEDLVEETGIHHLNKIR